MDAEPWDCDFKNSCFTGFTTGERKTLWTVIFVRSLSANNSEKGGSTFLWTVGTFNHYIVQKPKKHHNLHYIEFCVKYKQKWTLP